MANDNDSVDSNGNSNDLKPRRSNRAKGKPIQQLEETDENLVVHNNVVYKVGDFVYYLDKKQDIYRIGLIEEFKHQKRDKLVNKRPEISLKQFYRLDEIPVTVLSNQGEYDTHVMPPNFPEWLRQREIFISDNALSTTCSSLRSLCTVRHFPDLNHAMALFSSAQSSGQVTNSSPRVDHHTLITGKDNGCIPIPKQRDDNTFFYVFSYNARGRKLTATYLEIRVGPSYQVELPDLLNVEDQSTDGRYVPGAWEQLMWKPNQIPDEVFNVYNMATISIACFSGFGGGVDDIASVENGRKIASHMLTCQRAMDCLHKSQYSMEKAMESFAENSLPEISKMPFLWTDEDHILFDESVKIHGKNFLRIMQDKRNKKGRLVGDFVTFYYYWKKNRPKNRKYTTKKNLRSRSSNTALSEQHNSQDSNDLVKKEPTVSTTDINGVDRPIDGEVTQSPPNDPSIECCSNCKTPLPKTEEEASPDSDKTLLSDRMKILCSKCQHYLRRYGYQKPIDIIDKIKTSDDEDEMGDFEEGINGFDEEEDEEEVEGEEDEEDEPFPVSNSPQNSRETEDNSIKYPNQCVIGSLLENKNTLAINKYDFDEEDENVEEVSSLLKRNHAKQNLLRDTDPKSTGFKNQTNGSAYFPATNPITSYLSNNSSSANNKPINKSTTSATSVAPPSSSNQSAKNTVKSGDLQSKTTKRSSLLKKFTADSCKKRKLESAEESAVTSRPSSVSSRNSILNPSVGKHIHESLKSSLAQTHPIGGFNKKLDGKKAGLTGQSDVNNGQYESNTSMSSSSTSSNDSSSSDDEPAASHVIKVTENNIELKADSQSKVDSSDSSYNQMITSIPNIPGVCAVTNVGEPMPQLMHNLSTDLSSSQPSSVTDLNITVAEPLYKQLSLRHTVTASATASVATVSPSDSVASANKVTQSAGSTPIEAVSKFVNFNSISNQRLDNNPEETGLNLVKPKKRMDSSFVEHNWAPPHDSPSKLVHHRGDNSIGESTPGDPVKQMINDNEVVHCSIFGHIVRFIKSGEGCARTDLQHTTASLKPADLERKRVYISSHVTGDTLAVGAAVGPSTAPAPVAGQDTQTRRPPAERQCAMPPPAAEKNQMHHGSVPKTFNIPPLTHSSSSTAGASASTLSQPHGRKMTSGHGIRSPSPAGSNRPQSSFPSISSSLARPGHMHGTGLHSSQASSQVRPGLHLTPGMQSVPNSPLLADYNNMNKVNMNELLFYQSLNQTYEEMAKHQELQKLIMMYNTPVPQVRSMPWDQRDRFGSGTDAWNGGMSVPGLGPLGQGGVPLSPDIQTLLRALSSHAAPQAPVASPHTRPRSATGLNLSQGGMPGPGIAAGHSGGDKPSSGRASVNNHDFQRPMVDPSQMVANSPEVLETLRILMQDQMYGMLGIPKIPVTMHHSQQPQTSQQPLQQPQQQQTNPPVAHALNNMAAVVGGFPGLPNPHLASLPQNLLAQMQAPAQAPPGKPAVNTQVFGGPNCPSQRQNLNDLFQMFMNCQRNNNPR